MANGLSLFRVAFQTSLKHFDLGAEVIVSGAEVRQPLLRSACLILTNLAFTVGGLYPRHTILIHAAELRRIVLGDGDTPRLSYLQTRLRARLWAGLGNRTRIRGVSHVGILLPKTKTCQSPTLKAMKQLLHQPQRYTMFL